MEARVAALEQRMEEVIGRVDAIDKELEGVAHIRPAGSSYKEMVDGLMQSAVEDAIKKAARRGGKEVNGARDRRCGLRGSPVKRRSNLQGR